MKKFTSFIIFIITVIIVALIGLFIHHKFTSRKHVPQPPPTVTVTTLASRTYQTKIHIVGTLIAVNGITLKTAIAGQITKLDFESNQEVKKGQLLLEVDPAELQAQLASDEAQLEKDKLTLDRNKKLVARQVITEEAFDESEASYKQSVAAVAAVQAQLRNAIITAPFAGKIGIRDVQLGDYLSTGDTITTITRLDPLWADFNVPTKYLNSVKIGQIVHINNEAFPDDTFTGKVTATEPQADSGTDSFTVRATIENPDKKLLPGQSVDVTLLTGQPTQIIAAPAIAVIYRDNKTFLYKVTNDEAKLVPVTVGEQTGQDMIITSGIQAGDTIVVDGTNKIIGDQGKISPVDVNDPSANTSATGQENTSASSSSDDTQHNKQSAKKSNSDARAP